MSQEFLQQLFGLDGQTCVVIGGTGVLGGALCDGIASAGANVVVAGRSKDRGEQRVKMIEEAGGKASFQPVDAASRSSLESLYENAKQDFGRVDLLVNCAGINSSEPYEEISEEDWDNVVDTNLKATHLACQVFAPRFTTNENGGAILNIGSVTAHIPLSKVFAYAAAKAGVVNLTKNVAREYATKNVRVNVLCPGFFPAEQNRLLLTPERTQQIIDQTPMQRFGEPSELIGTVILLLSQKAGSYITGADFYVDGGFTAMRF